MPAARNHHWDGEEIQSESKTVNSNGYPFRQPQQTMRQVMDRGIRELANSSTTSHANLLQRGSFAAGDEVAADYRTPNPLLGGSFPEQGEAVDWHSIVIQQREHSRLATPTYQGFDGSDLDPSPAPHGHISTPMEANLLWPIQPWSHVQRHPTNNRHLAEDIELVDRLFLDPAASSIPDERGQDSYQLDSGVYSRKNHEQVDRSSRDNDLEDESLVRSRRRHQGSRDRRRKPHGRSHGLA